MFLLNFNKKRADNVPTLRATIFGRFTGSKFEKGAMAIVEMAQVSSKIFPRNF
jgi:hypothetical protein